MTRLLLGRWSLTCARCRKLVGRAGRGGLNDGGGLGEDEVGKGVEEWR
jgi:hypothetical protein